jgi:prevent-host-death family protein
MPQIRPITDLRNTTEISELCHNTAEPVFITKNGYGDLVVMSIEAYERKLAISEVYEKLAEAEAEIAGGAAFLDGEDVLRRLREKHGSRV